MFLREDICFLCFGGRIYDINARRYIHINVENRVSWVLAAAGEVGLGIFRRCRGFPNSSRWKNAKNRQSRKINRQTGPTRNIPWVSLPPWVAEKRRKKRLPLLWRQQVIFLSPSLSIIVLLIWRVLWGIAWLPCLPYHPTHLEGDKFKATAGQFSGSPDSHTTTLKKTFIRISLTFFSGECDSRRFRFFWGREEFPPSWMRPNEILAQSFFFQNWWHQFPPLKRILISPTFLDDGGARKCFFQKITRRWKIEKVTGWLFTFCLDTFFRFLAKAIFRCQRNENGHRTPKRTSGKMRSRARNSPILHYNSIFPSLLNIWGHKYISSIFSIIYLANPSVVVLPCSFPGESMRGE